MAGRASGGTGVERGHQCGTLRAGHPARCSVAVDAAAERRRRPTRQQTHSAFQGDAARHGTAAPPPRQ
ncbi:hypothetical protein BU14_0093s0032 [Porphyra umbilicalis]|uniref:Uncharacterized protein n=1 Tax=Porphyra umbilicalis TaxID=2786 RepID=A0A1X6PDM4_PORUM|nr:hypothetical protein BU14_0093s0032 [Porphyra umbilicalis]|eukprot:OSX78989.1 hypothetical protein BU14_0093s0032 [Porphyra umbilicalis]